MKAWYGVKCHYGDCMTETKIGGDKGRDGWELVGWYTKKWYCSEHGLAIISRRRQALSYNTGEVAKQPATPESTLDELMNLI